jgi:hypothetical protein
MLSLLRWGSLFVLVMMTLLGPSSIMRSNVWYLGAGYWVGSNGDWAIGVSNPVPAEMLWDDAHARYEWWMYQGSLTEQPLLRLSVGQMFLTWLSALLLLIPSWIVHAWLINPPRSLACAFCGYSLSGLSSTSPCPECGSPTPLT